jgi:pilus assembly protein Flp/PilA
MRGVIRWCVRFASSEEGPTAVEYAVMMALIIATCILAITTLGTNSNNAFVRSGNAARPGGS